MQVCSVSVPPKLLPLRWSYHHPSLKRHQVGPKMWSNLPVTPSKTSKKPSMKLNHLHSRSILNSSRLFDTNSPRLNIWRWRIINLRSIQRKMRRKWAVTQTKTRRQNKSETNHDEHMSAAEQYSAFAWVQSQSSKEYKRRVKRLPTDMPFDSQNTNETFKSNLAIVANWFVQIYSTKHVTL